MSKTLLHKVLGDLVSPQADTEAAQRVSHQDPERLLASGMPQHEGAPRVSGMRSGRFNRWHLELTPPHEEEAWLITYLDVITLLLAMMVVMLAFSEPTKNHMSGDDRRLAPDAQAATATEPASRGTTIVPPVPLPHPVVVAQPTPPDPQPPAVSAQPPEAVPSPVALDDLGQDIEVKVEQGVVRFRISSEILFASGDAALTPGGQALIDKLLPVFNRAPDHNIVVEGHTDNVPINTARFPSNWELAAGRAGSVVRHLEARGLNPTRLRAVGLAETRPIASNASPEGRAANRRVEIAMESPRAPAVR